jgi:putative phosphoribosyl transferase
VHSFVSRAIEFANIEFANDVDSVHIWAAERTVPILDVPILDVPILGGGGRSMFQDRVDAGRKLATLLHDLRGPATVVLGIPRGGVIVAREVARALGAPLDVVVVRKLGSARHPEYAVGAIGEDGVRIVDPDALRTMGVREQELAEVEARERVELARRTSRFRSGRPRIDLAGKRTIVVDDGVATGATAIAACRACRQLGSAEVVVAVPVAPPDWIEHMRGEADRFIAVETPAPFFAVGQWYEDFEQTTDDEVVACLADADSDGADN